MPVLETLSSLPEAPLASEEQQAFLLFIADMDAASETAKADGASETEVAALYEAYGDRLHAFVGEDYSAGRQQLSAAMAYLRQHDCSLEAAQNLESAYTSKHGNTPHDHVPGEDHAAASHESGHTQKGKNKRQKAREKVAAWWQTRRPSASILDFLSAAPTRHPNNR